MEEFELEPGEQVILHVRKHWLVFAGELLPYALLAWLPTLLPWLGNLLLRVGGANAHIPDLSTANPWVHLALGLWWLLLWIGAFNRFTQYFLNLWVITNQRIVEIHQYGFFDRQVSSFLMARVQDVTTTVDGLFATIFGYGTVRIETAGTDSKHFVMSGLKDPQGMRDLIMREIALLHDQGAQTGL